MTKLTTNQWQAIIKSLVLSNEEHALIPLMQNPTIGWPEAETFKSIISEIPIASNKTISVKPDPLDKQEPKKLKNANIIWWDLAIKNYSLNLMDIERINPNIKYWFMAEREYSPLISALENTSIKDLEKWLLRKTHVTHTSSGYDKCLIFSALTYSGAKELLEAITAKYPKWVDLQDRKNRNALFFARSEKMVSFLCSANIDQNIKNTDNQTPVHYWTEVIKQSNLQDLIQETVRYSSNLTPQQKTDNIIANQLFSLSIDKLNKEERESFDKYIENKNFSWEGRLCGVDRVWSLPEIWQFGQLMLAFSEVDPPEKLKKNMHYSYLVTPLVKRNPEELVDFINECNKSLDTKASNYLNSLDSMDCKIYNWLIEFKAKSTDKELITVKRPDRNYYGYQRDPSWDNSAKMANSKFFKPMTDKEKIEWAESMDSYWGCGWVMKTEGNIPWVEKINYVIEKSSTPISIGGLASDQLAQSWAAQTQGQGIRGDKGVTWLTHFIDNFKDFNPNDKNSLSDWAPVLRMALASLGSADTKRFARRSVVEKNIIQMISSGVPMHKVPIRWTRNYSDELKSTVTNWVIRSEIDKRLKKVNKEKVETRKRKIM